MKTIGKAIIGLSLTLALAGCGGGGNSEPVSVASVATPTVAPAPVPAAPVVAATVDKVVSVTVNADMSMGDYYLKDVTFKTEKAEYHVEYCNDPVNVGDEVRLMPYGVGTTLLFVNKKIVDTIVDWAATEDNIKDFDPEKSRAGDYDIGMAETNAYIIANDSL